MTEPERIWAWEPKSGRGMWVGNPALNGFYGTEYIRHDAAALAASPLVQDMIRQAVEAEREAIAVMAEDWDAWDATAQGIAAAIRARMGE